MIAALFLSQAIFQLIFPVFQRWEGVSNEDLHGMSIMDQEAIFLPYGAAIGSFFLVVVSYLVAPQGKILIPFSLLILGGLVAFGDEKLTEGITVGALGGLLFVFILQRVLYLPG